MIKRNPVSCIETTCLLSVYRSEEIYQEILAIKNRLSMLHADVLMLLYHFSRYCDEGIIEIGPHVGGSTIALAKGLSAESRGKPFITIEIGGRFDHHLPAFSTNDIISDLKTNLKEYHVRHLVDIVEGDSRESQVIDIVFKKMNKRKADLFVIDSDGMVLGDISAYTDIMTDDCFFFIDDYLSPGNIEKGNITKSHVDFLVENHFMECLGIYGWGTWIGKRTGRKFPESFNEKNKNIVSLDPSQEER
ncbi:MAG: hypothetical protein R6X10_06860 [Desulfobacterales bacterium]